MDNPDYSDVDILNRIILLQRTIYSIENKELIPNLVIEGLTVLPGFSKCGLCLNGMYYTDSSVSKIKDTCNPEPSYCDVCISDEYNVVFCIQTENHFFGKLFFKTEHTFLIEPFKMALQNIADSVAMVLEIWSLTQKINCQDDNQKENIEAIVKAIPDLLFVIRKDMLLLEYKAQNENDLLAPRDQIFGSSAQEILPENVYELTKKHLNEVLSSGEVREFRYTMDVGYAKQHFEARMVPRKKDDVLVIIRNITERIRHNASREAHIALLEFAENATLKEVLKRFLDETEKLTDSSIGFYHFVDDNQESLHLQMWSTRTMSEMCKTSGEGLHYPISQAGVWVDCVRDGKPVIHNDYESLTHKRGLPDGHAPVIRELVVPVVKGGKIKAILGVGNKLKDYTEEDVETVNHFAELIWQTVEKMRLEESLREEKDKLNKILNSMEDSVFIHPAFLDGFGNINYVNEAGIRKYGYSLEQFMRMKVSELRCEEAIPESQSLDKLKKVRELENIVFESVHISQSGNMFPVEVNSTIIKIDKKPYVLSVVRDISERKNYENQLNTILSTVQQGILVENVDRNVKYVNPYFCSMFGLGSPESIQNTDSGKLLLKVSSYFSESNLFKDDIEFCISQLEPVKYYFTQTNDGRFFERSFTPIRQDTRITGYLWIYNDITDQIKSEEDYEVLFNEMKEGVVLLNFSNNDNSHTNLNVVRGNKSFYKMFNSKTLMFNLPEELNEFIHERFHETMLNGIPISEEHYFSTIGKAYYLSAFRSAPEQLAVFISDVSKRQEYENELIKNQYYLKKSQEIGKIGTWELDVVNNILKWTEENYKIFGVKMGTPQTYETFLQCVHPDDRMYINEKWLSALNDGNYYVEHRVIADGVVKWVREKADIEFDQEGNAILAVGVTQDISDIKMSEKEHEDLREQFNQAQKMESIGRLAGGVAHDFNNMLGVIMGYADLALMKSSDNTSVIEELHEIMNAAEKSTFLVRQLLAFARKQKISPNYLYINDCVEKMLKTLRRLIGENIELVWKPASFSKQVYVDPSHLDQILVNLCINSKDAIEGSGTITIESKLIESEEVEDELVEIAPEEFSDSEIKTEFVQLKIADNGCGMTPDVLAKIFEPFFTTKDKDKGTGLGLATVYGIIRQNRGFIQVDSEQGVGTEFTIYFPACTETCDDESENEEAVISGKGEIVLIVEDEVQNLKITTLMLKRMNYNVQTAQLPSQALNIAEKTSRLDLLLTDVIMPEMDGKTLADKIRTMHPECSIMFMSGYTDDYIDKHGIHKDGQFFIQKPFTIRKISESIAKALKS